jgi:hypothetical protein
VNDLQTLTTELTWDRIDTAPVQHEVDDLNAQLTQANSPQATYLAELLKKQRTRPPQQPQESSSSSMSMKSSTRRGVI